jgi:hypothetical protein
MSYSGFDVTFLWVAPTFIAGILIFSLVMSLLGGWYGLAKRHPVPEDIGSVLGMHKFKSLTIGYMTAYRTVISFTITDKGILIHPSLFLLVLHRPLFLPWGEITEVKYKARLLTSVIFRIGGTRLVTSGKAARSIFKAYNEHFKQ